MRKKIVVTGGAGFVGSNLIKYLLIGKLILQYIEYRQLYLWI